MVYYLPDGFEPKITPHGNSKSGKPYYPTLPSTIAAMASSAGGGPKQVVGDVSAAIGGVLSASDACSLPRNEQQVTDIKRRQKRGSSGSTDELAVVIQKAYLEDGDKCFIREMKTLREPAIIAALDWQLDDLVRFCTNEEEFGILTVDPTFSLGDFDVTVTAYRQLILRCRWSSEHPVFIGPVMVHYKKSYSTYLFFASTLLGVRSALSKLKCFGTDGEQALFEAFQTAFPGAIHLFCSLHMKRNIKAKLRDLGVRQSSQEIVISDIFGQQIGSHQVEGLLDSENDENFEEGCRVIAEKWKNMDAENSGPMHNMFVTWFYRHKYSLIKKSMLKPRQGWVIHQRPSQLMPVRALIQS